MIPMANPAWAARCDDLTSFAVRRLVNRLDAAGSYWIKDGAIQQFTIKADGMRRAPLRIRLRRHFGARTPEAIIGLHALSAESTCKWLAWDIDRHNESVSADDNVSAMGRLVDFLHASGIEPLIEDSNGNGGFHVWVLLTDEIPGTLAHRFGKYAIGVAQLGDCEVFPKQESLSDGVRYGNWLRCPGRHHRRDHWSGFLDTSDDQWKYNAAAVELMLAATLNEPSLIERMSPNFPPPPQRHALPIVISSDMPMCIDDLIRNSIRNPGDRNRGALTIARWAKAAGESEDAAIRRVTDFMCQIPRELTSAEMDRVAMDSNARSVVGAVYRGSYPWDCGFAWSLGTVDRPIACNISRCRFVRPQAANTSGPDGANAANDSQRNT